MHWTNFLYVTWESIFQWFLKNIGEHIVDSLVEGIKNEASFSFGDFSHFPFADEATQVRQVDSVGTEASEDLS